MEILIGLAVFGIGLLFFVALPIAAFVRTVTLSRQIETLTRRLDELTQWAQSTPTPSPSTPPAASSVDTPRASTAEQAAPTVAPVTTFAPPVAARDLTPARGTYDLHPIAAPDLARSVDDADRMPPSPSPAAAIDDRPASPAPERLSFEARVGGRWLLYAAVATLLVATSYFLKFAFDNEWITPTLRVALGAVAGLAAVAVGMRLTERGTRLFGQVIVGGGIALLYLTAYAAHHFYEMTSREATFGLMVAITALGAWAGNIQRAQALAMVALIGGFATPLLVGGQDDAQVVLFTYLAIVVAGGVWLARRHAWSALPVVAFALSVFTFLAWAGVHYAPSKWVATEVFLTVFVALFVVAWMGVRAGTSMAARVASAVLVLAPVAYHLASIANLLEVDNRVWLLAYLIAATAAGLAVAVRAGLAWLRLAVWMAAALPLSGWADGVSDGVWLSPGLVALVAIYGLHLLSAWKTWGHTDERLHPADVLLLYGNGLWACDVVDSLLSPVALAWIGPVVAGLALWHLALAGAVSRQHRDAMLHFVALAFALAAISVAIVFDGPGRIAGWAAVAAALGWVGLSANRPWMRVAAGALGVLAVLLLLDQHERTLAVGTWPLANVRFGLTAFTVGLLYFAAWWHARVPLLRGSRAVVATLVVVASLVTIVALTTELRVYFDLAIWQAGDVGAGVATSGAAARQVATSITWAGYALLMLAIGLRRAYAPIRYVAVALFVITLAKVFVVDLAALDRGYRVVATFGLGVLLLVASWLYQRLVAPPREA